jgi:hypothetical protein
MIVNFLKTIPFRIANWKTTFGGSVLGVVGAGIMQKIEEQTGCHIGEVFMGIDWAQILIFILSQLFGLLTTDANKKVE